ncbi:MAG: isocitrate dehydrogenase [Myxococcales bacterium]
MSHHVVLIPGDGIGPEVSEATVRAVDALALGIRWVPVEAGAGAVERHGTPLPPAVTEAVRTHRVALKGPITTPVGKGFTSVNVALRKELDLYVSLRPVQSMAGVDTPYTGVDLVVFRENTEGLYSGLEHVVTEGVVESLKVITERASRRIARYAYEYARNEGRRRVAIVHKASIMKLSDGLFRRTALDVADDYPFVETQDVSIDDAFMNLALDPSAYDCLVMENLYGDVLSDLCAGLVGGLGVVPGANIGEKYAVFEAVHGSAPDIAGKGVANPTALMLSAVLMLKHMGWREPGRRLERAIRHVIARRETVTADLGGKATTREYTDAVIAALEVV